MAELKKSSLQILCVSSGDLTSWPIVLGLQRFHNRFLLLFEKKRKSQNCLIQASRRHLCSSTCTHEYTNVLLVKIVQDPSSQIFGLTGIVLSPKKWMRWYESFSTIPRQYRLYPNPLETHQSWSAHLQKKKHTYVYNLYIHYTQILLAIQPYLLYSKCYKPMEKASPFPENSSFKTETNLSLIFSFCIIRI